MTEMTSLTLCCVGRDDGDAPLLSVANETDVLVACWQSKVKERARLAGGASDIGTFWLERT